MATTISFSYSYGKYTHFSFPKGNQVTYEYEWEDPVGEGGAALPKKVVSVFHAQVKKVLTEFMKGEDRTVNAICAQLRQWDSNIKNHKISDPKELAEFVEHVNTALAKRSSDKFADIEGGIMPIVKSRVWSSLDAAVQEKLKRDKWIVKAKVVGTLVIAVSAVALSIVATVLTAGAAAPIALAACTGALTLAKESYTAWQNYKSAEKSVYALTRLVDDHKKACGGASTVIDTVEAEIYALKADIKAKRKSLDTLSKSVEALIKTLESTPNKAKELTDMETILTKTLAEKSTMEANLKSAETALSTLQDMLTLAKEVFDPTRLKRPPDGKWQKLFSAIEPFAPWVQRLSSIAGSTLTIIKKYT